MTDDSAGAARPPDRRVRRTRQALRDALISLILEKGYEATTVRDIVDRADVGRSAFYAHFIDKEDLLLSTFQEMHDTIARATGASPAALFAISRELFRLADRDRRLYRAVIGRFGSGPLLVRTEQEMFEWVRDEFLEVSGRTVQTASLAARLAVSAFLGLLRWWLEGDEPLAPDDVSDAFVALALPGVAAFLGVAPERLMSREGASSAVRS